jgi:hypothetical protein
MWRRFRGWDKFVFAAIAPAMLLFAFPLSAQQQTAPPPVQGPPKTDANQQAGESQQSGDKTQDKTKDKDKDKDKKDQQDQKDTPPPIDPSTGASKNDRIFGVIPNYNTVVGATEITPIRPAQKFKLAFSSVLDPYTYGIVSILALEDQARGDPSEWGGGFKGFGRRYAAALTDQTIGPVMSTGLFPTLLHEDPRYFQLGKGGFKKRFAYSMERLVITRTDSGHRQFNYSEFLGNATATAISNLYYPPSERTVGGNIGVFASQVAVDALANFLKEFWPDMKRKLRKQKND